MRTYAYTGIFHDLCWSRMDFFMARSSSSSVKYVCFEMICVCMYIHAFYTHILCFAFELLAGSISSSVGCMCIQTVCMCT